MRGDPWGAISALSAVLTLPVGLLVGLFVGFEAAAVVFIVGWFLLVPVAPVLGHHILPMLRSRGADESGDEPADPHEELKRQYVEGELDEDEFERRVRNLVAIDQADEEAVEQALGSVDFDEAESAVAESDDADAASGGPAGEAQREAEPE